MSDSTLRIVVAVVLIAHGVGHILGILPAGGVKLSRTHSPNSWLFTKLLGNIGARVIGFVIFLLALLGFVGAGLGLLGWLIPTAWWASLAIGASILSLLGFVFFWNAFPFFFPNKVGAIAVDVAVLVGQCWFDWPS